MTGKRKRTIAKNGGGNTARRKKGGRPQLRDCTRDCARQRQTDIGESGARRLHAEISEHNTSCLDILIVIKSHMET